jgi:rSAM/selenodomain-associated transferase 1
MSRKQHLIVFAREPRLGTVKRRLAKGLGIVAAGFWYRRQLWNLLRRLKGRARRRHHLFVTPPTALGAPIWPRGWKTWAQTDGDLGARMHHALSVPGTGPAVLVGSDIPEIEARHIDAAFRALTRADVVLGPAADGGYWLIGMRRRRSPPRFGRIRWSTAHALEDTIAGFPEGTTVELLEVLQDVDEVGDLEQRGEPKGKPRR